jgi:hypothetical protein
VIAYLSGVLGGLKQDGFVTDGALSLTPKGLAMYERLQAKRFCLYAHEVIPALRVIQNGEPLDPDLVFVVLAHCEPTPYTHQ